MFSVTQFHELEGKQTAQYCQRDAVTDIVRRADREDSPGIPRLQYCGKCSCSGEQHQPADETPPESSANQCRHCRAARSNEKQEPSAATPEKIRAEQGEDDREQAEDAGESASRETAPLCGKVP